MRVLLNYNYFKLQKKSISILIQNIKHKTSEWNIEIAKELFDPLRTLKNLSPLKSQKIFYKVHKAYKNFLEILILLVLGVPLFSVGLLEDLLSYFIFKILFIIK